MRNDARGLIPAPRPRVSRSDVYSGPKCVACGAKARLRASRGKVEIATCLPCGREEHECTCPRTS